MSFRLLTLRLTIRSSNYSRCLGNRNADHSILLLLVRHTSPHTIATDCDPDRECTLPTLGTLSGSIVEPALPIICGMNATESTTLVVTVTVDTVSTLANAEADAVSDAAAAAVKLC
jgi:hypothetical protein